nr:hypothetical protein [Mucilaginibacter sp. SP1R1]
MGLPLRITFKDTDYIYKIITCHQINLYTIEVEMLFEGEKVIITRDKSNLWSQKEGGLLLDRELILALGRSVSLRLRT